MSIDVPRLFIDGDCELANQGGMSDVEMRLLGWESLMWARLKGVCLMLNFESLVKRSFDGYPPRSDSDREIQCWFNS
jgi:hypothetical protein